MQDWNYLHTNDFEITLEIGCFKFPKHEHLPEFWDENRDALMAFMEKVHTGIKGMVTDKEGRPLANATIEVGAILLVHFISTFRTYMVNHFSTVRCRTHLCCSYSRQSSKSITLEILLQVEGIRHVVKSTAYGDYFRLLAPGHYTVTVSHPGHAPSTATDVHVPEGVLADQLTGALSAKILNFTLEEDMSKEWSIAKDFGIEENLNTR